MNIEDILKRREDLNRLSMVLLNNIDEWCKISTEETFVTRKYAEIDNLQARLGMKFDNFEIEYLLRREPLGVARIQAPMNAVGVTLGASVAPAYLAGNRIDIRLSSRQQKLSHFIQDMIRESEVEDVSVIIQDPKEFIRESINGNFDVLQCYGHDRTIMPWYDEIREGIKDGRLSAFASELPGNDYSIVTEYADLEEVTPHLINTSTISSGQICMATEGIFSHVSKVDELIKNAKREISNLVVGNPYDPKTDIGPLMSERVYRSAQEQIKDAVSRGAEVIKGIKCKVTREWLDAEENAESKKRIIFPYLIVVNDWESKIAQEESFCPIILILPYEHMEKVIEHIAKGKYGLTTTVYTKNLVDFNIFENRLKNIVGIVFKNQPFFKAFNPHLLGWGGRRNSGCVMYRGHDGELIEYDGPKQMLNLFSKPMND